MKRILTSLFFVLMAVQNITLTAAAPTKTDKRVTYTITNLKLNEQQKKALKPLLYDYLNEMKEAKKQEKDLEKKYEKSIDNNTLTDAQAKQLLDARWPCDSRELEVKKKYYPKFMAVLPAKKVYKLFSLINDKMSKIEGRSKSRGNASNDD